MLCGLHPQPLGMATAFGCKEVREALEKLLEDAKSEAAAEREVAAESAITARADQGELAAVHAAQAKHDRDEAARVAASVAAHVDDAPAVEGKRSVARPTPEMEALLEAKAGLLGLELNLEARREQRPTGLSPRGQDATGHAGRQPSAEDEGDQAPSLHAGVQHTPMLSSYVDEGSIAAFYHSVGNGSNSHTSQLYLAFKQGEEHATAMACDLMTTLGSNLSEVYPELCNNSVVVPVMGHDEVHTSPAGRTFALADALGLGEVNTAILSHKPRLAVKEFTTAEERNKLLFDKYSADLTSWRQGLPAMPIHLTSFWSTTPPHSAPRHDQRDRAHYGFIKGQASAIGLPPHLRPPLS